MLVGSWLNHVVPFLLITLLGWRALFGKWIIIHMKGWLVVDLVQQIKEGYELKLELILGCQVVVDHLI